MATSEAARHDLYTGLSEVLGPERAGVLMSALPPVGFDDLATKRDLEDLATKRDLQSLEKRFDSLERRLAGIDARIDRLFYLMVIAMLGMLAAVTTLVVSL